MRKPKTTRGRTAMASIRAELPAIEAGIQPATDRCGPNISDPERIACGAAGIGIIAAAEFFSRPHRLRPRDIVPGALSRGGVRTPDRSAHLLLAAVGGAMLYRAISGFCPLYRLLSMPSGQHSTIGVPSGQGVKCVETVEVDGAPSEVFAFWRQLSNLPLLFSHLDSVVESENKRSHWIALGPLNKRVEWDAEIINERPNELIAWRSIPGSSLDTAGSVHFEPREEGGTKVQLSLKYDPPGGRLAISIAELLGEGLGEQLVEGLHKLQWVLSANERAADDERSTSDSGHGTQSAG